MQKEMKASQPICESATEKLLHIALLTELIEVQKQIGKMADQLQALANRVTQIAALDAKEGTNGK